MQKHPVSIGESALKLVATSKMRHQIFLQLHAGPLGGHWGQNRTIDAISRRFYWPGCRKDVEKWLQQCDDCARVKPGPKHRAHMTPMNTGTVMDRVAMDILGELPETERGNKYILVVSDYFTKWVEAYALPNQTAMTIADVFVSQFITRFGAPRYIHSDMGQNFESKLFHEMCKLLGIKKSHTSSYHPQSDGLVERFNRSLLQTLRIVVGDHEEEWDEYIPYVTAAYRHTRHESTGFTPFFLMYGRNVNLPIDLQVGSPPKETPECTNEYVLWLQETIQEAHQLARKHTKQAAERQKNYYDSRFHPYHFQVGQFVWRYYPLLARRKLTKGWTGPYKIHATPNPHHCLIQSKPGGKIIKVHCDQLKVYRGIQPRGWGKIVEGSEESETEEENREGSETQENKPPEDEVSGESEIEENKNPEEGEIQDDNLPKEEVSEDTEIEDSINVPMEPEDQGEHLGRGMRRKRPPKRLDW